MSTAAERIDAWPAYPMSDLRGKRPAPAVVARSGGGVRALGDWARRSLPGDHFVDDPLLAAADLELRAMSASGGVGADSVYGQVWSSAVATSQLLQAGVDRLDTQDGNTLPIPVASTPAATSDTATAANAALATSDATMTTVNSTVSKFDYLTLVPGELEQDAMFDLGAYLAAAAGRELGRRIVKQANIAYIAGFNVIGVTGPVGTTTSLGTQSTAGMGSDLLGSLYRSVLPDYRSTASWVMNDTTATIIENLKSSNGEAVFPPNEPLTIQGRPVYIDNFLPSPAASAITIYFGDWAALKIRVAGGVRFEKSTSYGFASDQVAYRVIVRTGAIVADTAAVKSFKHSAT
jgi:HK97 family phage major capsid protein